MNIVQYEVAFMNTIVTSKEEILQTSRNLIRTQGWNAVSIRSVASACGVSVGSIYNYFESKTDLVTATVESVWCEIFHRPENRDVFEDTKTCIVWIYERLEYGGKEYPGFFTLHSLNFISKNRTDGKQKMQQTWQHILQGLCVVLKKDANVRENAFTENFTVEKFAGILFSLMLSAMLREDYDPSTVLELIQRTLY